MNAKTNQPDKATPRPFNGALANFTDRVKPWTLADELAMNRIDVELDALESAAEAAKDLKEQRDYLYAFLNGFVIPHEVADDPKEFVAQVDKIAAKAREVLNTCRIRGDHSDTLANLAAVRGQKAGGK